VAKGLEYLHSPIHRDNDGDDSRSYIIHGDIRAVGCIHIPVKLLLTVKLAG
jgi:hypothetical protein